MSSRPVVFRRPGVLLSSFLHPQTPRNAERSGVACDDLLMAPAEAMVLCESFHRPSPIFAITINPLELSISYQAKVDGANVTLSLGENDGAVTVVVRGG